MGLGFPSRTPSHLRSRRIRRQKFCLDCQGSSIKCSQKVLFPKWSCHPCCKPFQNKELANFPGCHFWTILRIWEAFWWNMPTVSLYSFQIMGLAGSTRLVLPTCDAPYGYKHSFYSSPVFLFPTPNILSVLCVVFRAFILIPFKLFLLATIALQIRHPQI